MDNLQHRISMQREHLASGMFCAEYMTHSFKGVLGIRLYTKVLVIVKTQGPAVHTFVCIPRIASQAVPVSISVSSYAKHYFLHSKHNDENHIQKLWHTETAVYQAALSTNEVTSRSSTKT